MKFKICSKEFFSKGKLWIPVMFAIALFMAFPVASLLKLGSWSEAKYTDSQMIMLYQNLWVDGLAVTGYCVAAAAGIVMGVVNFGYLYSGSKVDFYHSLPVTRGRMFFEKTMEGIFYFLIPYVVMEFAAICIGAMRGYFSLSLMGRAVLLLVMHLIGYLLNYFPAALVICLTGNILMGGLCLAALGVYGTAFEIVLNEYKRFFFYTSSYWTSGDIRNYLSPVFLGSKLMSGYKWDGFDYTLTGQVLLYILFFGISAYFAYVHRPSEKTGKTMIYPFTQSIIYFLVVIPTAFGVCITFCMIQETSNPLPWLIFGMAVGLVVSHMMMQILFHMDFRKCFSNKALFLTAGICVAAATLCFKFDLLGYDRYMPSEKNLDSIILDISSFPYEQSDMVTKAEDGTYELGRTKGLSSYFDSRYVGYSVGKSKEVYDIVKKAALTSRENYKKLYDEGKNDRAIDIQTISLKFYLKSGRMVWRNYCMSTEELKALMQAAYRDGILKEEKYSFLQVDPSYLTDLYINTVDFQSYSCLKELKGKEKELFEALREDVQEADAETLTGVPCCSLDMTFRIPVKEKPDNQVPQGGTATEHITAGMFIYPEFERTLAILKEMGYPLSMEEIPVSKVSVQYYRNETGPVLYTNDVVYESKEEIDALKEALIPQVLVSPWNRTVYDARLVFEIRVETEGVEGYETMKLLLDRCPEFILEDAEKAKEGAFGELSTGEEYATETSEVIYDTAVMD